jgi:hypothetical protein
MTTRQIDLKIVPIDWIDREERWVLVPPSNAENRRRRREKKITLKKHRCLFTADVPKGIIDFIYRAVRQLGLADRTLIFSRGTVRHNGRQSGSSVSIRELDWGVGTLVTIPRALKYGRHTVLTVRGHPCTCRLMELTVLEGLLRLAFPHEHGSFYEDTASLILAKGWSAL